MHRRFGLRGHTDFAVVAHDGCLASPCRGVELSATGMVIDRGRLAIERDERVLIDLELRLPERLRPVRALARPVWARGTQQAFKFVRMSDADRLTLAEHLDLLALGGAALA